MFLKKLKTFIFLAFFVGLFFGLYWITINQKILYHRFLDPFSVIDKNTNVKLVGNLSKPVSFNKGKILLLHGAGALGRKWPLYRLLHDKLSKNGYEVASFDFRTFGDSTKPQNKSYKYLNKIQDITIILNYLKWNSCHIIGHSMGASIGMNAIANKIITTEIKSIISIGPARRVKEIYLAEKSPNFYSAKRGLQNRLNTSMEISDLVIRKLLENINIDNSLKYFSRPKHVPIFLIDGENESNTDKLYLKKIF